MKRSLPFFLLLLCGLLLHPPAADASAEKTPLPIEVTSPGGIKAWLIQNERLPLLSLSFAFRGGVECDPIDKQGLATLTTSLLTQGAGPYDAAMFQDKLAAASIALELGAGRDALTGSLKTLRATREEAFRLLALALTKPRFDTRAFERVQAQQQTAIHFQLGDPEWQGRYALFRAIFGENPYSFRSLGSLQTLANIAPEDVRRFAKERLAKDNLVVTAVGAITPGELAAALDRIFGALPAHAKKVEIPAVAWPEKQTSVLVRREGTQTNLLFAAPMLSRKDPDWHAAQIANYILGGGGFVSRLMKKVREEKGLTYGIGTSLAPMDKASMLVGSLATSNEKAGASLALTLDVWRNLYTKGATAQEVEAAKAYLTGSLPLAITSTDGASALLLSLQLDGLARDYLQTRIRALKEVTPDDVNRVLRLWFNPALANLSFVGKPEDVSPAETMPLTED